jgi:hypothetical protein
MHRTERVVHRTRRSVVAPPPPLRRGRRYGPCAAACTNQVSGIGIEVQGHYASAGGQERDHAGKEAPQNRIKISSSTNPQPPAAASRALKELSIAFRRSALALPNCSPALLLKALRPSKGPIHKMKREKHNPFAASSHAVYRTRHAMFRT